MLKLDVNLWFARNQQNEIVSIINSNKEDEYICPICASKVIPKATESKKKSPHFAHIDISKCNGEALVHWWYKNKFIQKGDKFKIFTDKEIEFTCKDFNTEVTYQLENGAYRPDLVVETECGQEIVFEMANTNKKKVKDYIDRWIELDKIIVEVDIKSLQNVNDVKKFNALYYNGKCFNFNTRDEGYYEHVGKVKEEMKRCNRYDLELVRKLDWFWDEVAKLNKNEIDKDKIFQIMSSLKGSDSLDIIVSILKKKKCINIFEEFLIYLKDNIVAEINLLFEKTGGDTSIFRIVTTENIYYNKIIDFYLAIRSGYSDTIYGMRSILKENLDFTLLETKVNKILREKRLEKSYQEAKELTSKYLDNLSKELKLEDYYLCNYINPNNYKLCVGIKYKNTTVHIINIPDNYVDFSDEDGYLYLYLRNEITDYVNSTNEMENKIEVFKIIHDITDKYDYYFMGHVNDKRVKVFIDSDTYAKDTYLVTLGDFHNEKYYLYIRNGNIYHSSNFYFSKDVERYTELYGSIDNLESFIIKYYYDLHFSNIKCCNNNIIDYKEFEFCFKNNYRMPKLCKQCRQKRKKERLND